MDEDKETERWLDISCHPRVFRQLRTWGKRVGMSAEGYAKLLLLSAMHPLIAAEVQPEYDSIGPRSGAQQPEPHDEEKAASLEIWRNHMKTYEGCMDRCPAPAAVVEGARLYDADDFRWPGKKPTWTRYEVESDGQDCVSQWPAA